MPQETQCRVGLAAQRGAVQCFLASAGMVPEVASFGDHLQQRNRRSVIVREQTVGNAQILGQEAMEQPGPAEDACQAAAAQIGFGIILAFQSPEFHVHHPDPMAALALRLSGFRGKVVLHWHSDILSQRLLLLLYRPLLSWLTRRADVIVGTTPAYLQASPWLEGVQDKCVAVPIGIEPVRFDPDKAQAFRDRYPGKRIILSVGRLVPYKGFRYLVDALGRLPDAYHLVIGGTGPLRDELEAQIRENGLDSRVTLLGYVPSEDLPSWFGACDLFVLSSVMKTEAFGIVLIEAMSCGKPVVATRIPGSGVSWVNQEGVSGLNVSPADAAALAEAIRRVADGRERFGADARSLFEERYTFDGMIDGILAVYHSI